MNQFSAKFINQMNFQKVLPTPSLDLGCIASVHYREEGCIVYVLDWSDGQLFVLMEWWWSYFPNDGMAMVFENVSPSPFGGINHRQRWFFDGFSNVEDQCTMRKLQLEFRRRIFSCLRENFIWNIWTRIKWEGNLSEIFGRG